MVIVLLNFFRLCVFLRCGIQNLIFFDHGNGLVRVDGGGYMGQ